MNNNTSTKAPLPNSIISEDFLFSNHKKFISKYEIKLISYIEGKRVFTGFSKISIVEHEKNFIEEVAQFLINQNEINERIDEEYREKKMSEYCRLTNISKSDLKAEKIGIPEKTTYSGQKNLNLDYDEFSYKFDEENNHNSWLDRNKEAYSFNNKIHYLTLRANRIGYNTSFEGEVIFNEIKPAQQTETSLNGKFTKSQKFILLKELGIIDFIINKYPHLSENGLGKILMDITGNSNYQDKLNAHKNQGRNNPYDNEEAVNEIKQHLITIRKIDLDKY